MDDYDRNKGDEVILALDLLNCHFPSYWYLYS